MKIKAKAVAVASGLAMAMSMLSFAPMASAALTTDQVNAIVNLLKTYGADQATLANVQASLTGGSPVVTAGPVLGIGSKGAAVTALQKDLIAGGYSIPAIAAGAAYGYYGAQTASAVAARAAAMAPVVVTAPVNPNCPTGAVFNMVTGQACATTASTTTSTGIMTPGVEGTITVTSAPVSTGTLFEGDKNATVLAFKAKANTSDIAVQRVKLDLGTATTIYNKIYQKVSLVDDSGKVLAAIDLNSGTVVKDGSNYYVTLSGFNYVIAKDATKTLTIKMDVRTSIDSTDIDTETYTVRLSANGVRGVDGSGIDQFSPVNATDVTKTMTISANLVDSASLTLSTGANTPIINEVVASLGASNNELDKVTLLTFDIKAEKDSVLLTDLVATVTSAGGAATASSTFLYVDGNQIGSASASIATATFSDIDYTIAKDTTKTFTLKSDIRSANATQTTIAASVANSGLTAENSNGDSVTKSGSATGNNLLVRNDGPVFTLVSKNITYTAGGFSGATSTAKATFVINAKAIGGDIIFGTQAASTTFAFGTYKGSVLTTLLNASSTSFTIPSTGVVTSGLQTGQAFKISENGSADISVDFLFEGRTAAGALIATDAYAIGLENIKWALTAGVPVTSSFMTGRTEWRTSTVTMP
jgi:hypothetical protein